MTQAATGYVELDDGKVYYEAAGPQAPSRPPLVFLHAGFTGSGMWDEQWREFSQERAVIRYDLLGFGRSDPLQAPLSRRQELYRVLEQAGVSRAVLVGCSLGGETIIDAALERPERVAGLVIVSAVPSGFEMQGEPPAELMEMFAAVEQGDLERVPELQMRVSVDGPFRQPDEVDPAVRRRAAEMHRAALAKGSWGLTLAPDPDPLDPPAAQRLAEVRAPALVVTGGLDNPEILRAGDVLARGIPGARQVVIPGCAHLPNMEKPREFNEAVREWLKGVG